MADDPDPVVWDFRTPVTSRDLGARNDVVAEVQGGTPLTVVFPSGRRLEGEWGRGANAEGRIVGDGEPPAPIDTVVILESSVDTASDLMAAWERFEAEWGPLQPGEESPVTLIDEYADHRAETPLEPGQPPFRAAGDNVVAFRASEQDGVSPTFIVRFRSRNVTIRWVLDFEPAGV